VQFAFGGSFEVDNPDAVTSRLGLTGIPFMDVYNGCATAASALQLTADAIRSGSTRSASPWDGQAPARRVHLDPVDYAAPPGTASGPLPHHQVLRHEDQPLHARPRISHETLAKVAAKNYRNGGLNPNAFRRKPIPEDEILESRMLNYPLTQYMFCARRGCGARSCWATRHRHR
jgi:acetyl-CoA acetyltransferase